MAFRKNCRECGREYTDSSNFRRHIRTCGKKKDERGHYQCPYCPSTWARRDDVISKHVLYKHIDKVAEVMRKKELIKYVSHRESAMTDDEARDVAFLENLDRETRPYLGGSAEERDELQAQIDSRENEKKTETDRRTVVNTTKRQSKKIKRDTNLSDDDEPPKKRRAEEVHVHVSGSNVPTEPDYEETASYTSQDEPTFNTGASGCTGDGVPGSPMPGSLPVDITKSPYVHKFGVEDPQEFDPRKRFPPEVLIKTCRHGVRVPVHEHRYKLRILPDGTKEMQSETLVNCAECPRPAVKFDFSGI